MEIKVINEMRERFEVNVDGKTKASFIDGEPEDANMMRDFADVHTIPDLMKLAHEAGLNNEKMTVEYVKGEDE